jgi:probable F420-dependent oxidoreductase
VDIGLYMFPTDESIGPVELGRAAEERGFESLLFPEHTHIPASRATPYPAGGELPREYYRTYDPFVALAAVAATTERLRLGTGICLVVERDPIITAKEVASLDLLSGGRMLFGVGAGWNREEMANHGTDPATRFDLLVDRVRAMQAIWTGDEAEHHGPFVDFAPLHSWPKPVQRPHPPILVGGGGPTVIDRVLDIGDGWMPINRGDDEVLAAGITDLQRRAAERGRDPVPVTLFGARPRSDALARYAEMGVTRALLPVPSESEDAVLARLDRYTALLA